jgi:hypothetical protein
MKRFDISDQDFNEAIKRYVETTSPFKLKVFPKKEKQKVILLYLIINLFDKKVKYSEKEINDVLKPIYNDYVLLRRYLVDYNLLGRLDNGKLYWVKA